MPPLLSLVIPVLHDGPALRRLLAAVTPHPLVEVIVGAAEDGLDLTDLGRGDVRMARADRGRGPQMNAAAAAATGDWLLFLHADSRLPVAWLEVVREAIARNVVAGFFRFAIDDEAWQARVIERGVAWRVRLLQLPYGDQGLLVKRATFEEMGGFRDWPLMEDVDFVSRLKRRGPLFELPAALATSSRRWRRDGWFRRSTRNLALLLLYFAGVKPDALQRWY